MEVLVVCQCLLFKYIIEVEACFEDLVCVVISGNISKIQQSLI